MSKLPNRPLALFAVALLFACAAHVAGAPELVIDRSQCGKCGMLISDLAYSASLRGSDGSEKTFDDIHCLTQFVKGGKDAGLKIWVHDFDGEGFIDAASAHYVIASSIHAPMGGRVVAFAQLDAAEKFAGANGGRLVDSFDELLRIDLENAS